MRERLIESYLVAQVIAAGGEVRKVRWVGRNGAPDRCVMLPDGWLCWVETKATGALCRPHQLREHARMRRMGQRVLVVDTLDGVDELLIAYADSRFPQNR